MGDSLALESSLLSQSLKLLTSCAAGNGALVILALLLDEVLVALLLKLLIRIEGPFLSLVWLLTDSVLADFGRCSCIAVVRPSSAATAGQGAPSLALEAASPVNFAELFISFD